jgi:hypothetical protein
VYEAGPATSVVAAMAPRAIIDVVGDNAELSKVAFEADQRLRAALSAIETSVA